MTDDFDEPMTEAQLRQLLDDAERPRTLRSDELGRIRSVVEALGEQPSPTTVVEPEIVPEPVQPRPPRRRPRLVLAAAAAALVVVGLVFTVRGDDRTGVVASDAIPAASALEQACDGPVAALAEGIDAWDGIANWALTDRGDPPLDVLAAEALDALAGVGGLEADATAARDALSVAMDRSADLLGADRTVAQGQAVTTAVTSIIDLVAGHPDTAACDVRGLSEHLAN